MKYKEKRFAVIFWHNSLGWTVSEVLNSKEAAEIEMEHNKQILPLFDYRIVPCIVSFETKKAH